MTVRFPKPSLKSPASWCNAVLKLRLIVIVEKLVSEGMTQEEAFEFVEFNIEGAYVGEETPIIVWPGDINDYP